MNSEATELLDRSARADARGADLEAGESPREIGLRHRGITDSDTTTRSEELDNHAAGRERRYDELLSLGSYKSSFWVVLTRSWANVGLLFVPVAFILHYRPPGSVIPVVIINFIAIGALSGLLEFTSTQVALRVGGFAERIIT
ncbi:hypothetical protein RSOLAG1IB_12608 [Rhizoctonia solani AG-1 IB]|uniref:Uncharacterized protein n=1 Tax=Thanatephorus cucumeris (strain AG1-IB / isolate 7/3/14) TaxID=1108050 RepID=A0A0B7G1F7_THACB|nr:hypothetical protein RSOLAG1IB_12608 [Rhizoctonia solani AG-1 IB]